MADIVFQGADWLAASMSSGVLPASNDSLFVPQGLTHNKTDTLGNANPDIDLDLFKTHRDFSGDVGALGTPLMFATDLLIHEGSGALYFRCTADGVPNLTIDEVRIRAANSGVVVVLGSDPAAAGVADYTKIIVSRGHTTLEGNIVFSGSPKVIVGSMGDVLGDATLIIAADAPTLATLLQEGGTSTLHNVVTNLDIHAGTCFKETAAATNVNVHGGTLVYNHASVDADNVVIEVHAGATLDFMRSVAVDAATGAIRRTVDQVIAHPRSIVLYDETTVITDFVDMRTGVAA